MRLSSETTIDASADRVWEVIGHQFADIGEWATAIQASRPSQPAGDGDTPVGGRVCETGLAMFPQVEETIVSYDEAARTFTYAGAGLPAFVGEARNRWQVTPIDEHRSSVTLDAILETRGIAGRLLRVPLRLWLGREGSKMLDDLKHFVEHGRPSPRKQRQLASSDGNPAR